MEKEYRTINGYGEDEYIIDKSTFIGYSKAIEKEEEAIEFIDEINKKHYDATHNCHAYVFGKNNIIQRSSDDGEPSGTAGVPILEVLNKENLRNTVVVVTRYFGGIKLGAGGLIRAYTRGAKIAVDAGRIIDRTLHEELELRIEYTLYGAIENFLITNKYIVDDTTYDEAVNIFVAIKYDELEDFKEKIVNLTSDNVEIKNVGERYINLLNGKEIKGE